MKPILAVSSKVSGSWIMIHLQQHYWSFLGVEMSISMALTQDNSRPWQTCRDCSLQSSCFKDIKRTIDVKEVRSEMEN
jgi:hypothetical protein